MRSVNLFTLFTAGSIVLLAGCSSLNPFSSSAPKPAELVSFQPSAELRNVWQVRVGASGDYVF